MIYNWVLPSIAPLLLPWLAILALLALRPNRGSAAWWIWVPLGLIVGLTLVPLPVVIPSGAGFLVDVFVALAAGIAAVWLLSSYLRKRSRFMTFLCILLALTIFSALAFISKNATVVPGIESLQIGIVLAFSVLAISLALSVAGLICRKRYHPLALYPCLFIALTLIWTLMAVPFFIIALMTSGTAIQLRQLFEPVLWVATLSFAALLPFLVLSSASPFFRERFKVLLHASSWPVKVA